MICPICGTDPLYMRWTDFSGEANCMKCGIPLQIKWGTAEQMEEKNYPYIGMYPCLAEHFEERWEKTHKRARFGRWMGRPTQEIHDEQATFWEWMAEHHPEWEAPQSLATKVSRDE